MRPQPPPEPDPRLKRSLIGIGVLFLGIGIFMVIAGEAQAVADVKVVDAATPNDKASVELDIVYLDSDSIIGCRTWILNTNTTQDLFYMRSDDGGATWTQTKLATHAGASGATQCAIDAFGDRYVIVYQQAGTARWTTSTDAGVTWSPDADTTLPHAGGIDATDLDMVNDTIWYGIWPSGGGGFLRLTTDAGTTWTTQAVTTGTNRMSIVALSATEVWQIGGNAPGTISYCHTIDSGATCADAGARPNSNIGHLQVSGGRVMIGFQAFADSTIRVQYTDNDGATWTITDPLYTTGGADDGIRLKAFDTTQWMLAARDTVESDYVWITTTDAGVTADAEIVVPSTTISRNIGFDAFTFNNAGLSYFEDVTFDPRFVFVAIEAADLTVTGFTNLRDVRTDYENDPSVFVRSDTGGTNVGQIAGFSKLLTNRVNRNACTTQISTGADEYGLTVTFDGRIIWSCVATASNRAVLGSTSTISTPSTQYNSFDATTGAFTTIDSLTANDVVANQRDVAIWNVDLGGITSATAYTKTLTDVVHVTLDKGGLENHTWAVSDTAGTRAYTHDGLRVVNAPSITGLAIAAYNNTVYIGNATSIGRYDVAVDTLTLNGTAAGGVRIGGLRVSKDGAYLLQWQSATWTLRNSTTLAVVDSATASGTLFACDMDVRNNRVYCGSADTLFGWEVFDSTGSLAGNGTAGSENPAVAQTYFDSVESTFSDTPSVPVDPVTPLIDVTGLVPHFGTESKAKGFLAVFLVMALAGGLGALPAAGAGGRFSIPLGVLGGLAGFLLAYQLGLFPAWVIMFLALVLAAIGVQRFTSSRGA